MNILPYEMKRAHWRGTWHAIQRFRERADPFIEWWSSSNAAGESAAHCVRHAASNGAWLPRRWPRRLPQSIVSSVARH